MPGLKAGEERAAMVSRVKTIVCCAVSATALATPCAATNYFIQDIDDAGSWSDMYTGTTY